MRKSVPRLAIVRCTKSFKENPRSQRFCGTSFIPPPSSKTPRSFVLRAFFVIACVACTGRAWIATVVACHVIQGSHTTIYTVYFLVGWNFAWKRHALAPPRRGLPHCRGLCWPSPFSLTFWLAAASWQQSCSSQRKRSRFPRE